VTFQPDYSSATVVESPNFGDTAVGEHGRPKPIRRIVLHGTAGGGAVSWFANVASQVSAHYVVDTDGSVTQCVREDDVAWHAGEVTPDSVFAGTNPNQDSIGIEHVRDRLNASPLTAAQHGASIALIMDIRRRRGPVPLVPHDAIDVGRVCPGPSFPLAAINAAAHPQGDPNPMLTVTNIVIIDQKAATPQDDGGVDEAQDALERLLGCGEACAAMALRWATGRHVTVDTIHDALMAPGVDAYSYVGQLSGYLNAQGVSTHFVNIQDAHTARVQALRHIATGKPVICLLFWLRQQQSGGHFTLGAGHDQAQGVTIANPWGGFYETLSPDAWWQAYNGWLLFIDSPAHVAPTPAPAPTPGTSTSSGTTGAPGGAAPHQGARYLVTTRCMARLAPAVVAVRLPIQWLNPGAVLEGTGRITGGLPDAWVQVTAGAHAVFAQLKNLKRL